MVLELWIVLALAAVGTVLAVIARWRRKSRAPAAPEAGNVYPLW